MSGDLGGRLGDLDEALEGPDRAVLAHPDSVDRSVSNHDPDRCPGVGFAGRGLRYIGLQSSPSKKAFPQV